ncbi:P-loop containing nucleoside triphosphate hydrolase protein [Rhodocollybia butyracea]|uniref:P-loop containing nucleoside triphosphate hydrolase protein n=1 Tax=Rhodocollybia butyracea TaxID=206335 RepID=A0A9P5PZL8_9AGAR|nr:P-loop containing nucleoside triphosphate hydrolase protein [Rhodocollybia butyracea]
MVMAVLARILFGVCSSLVYHWSKGVEPRAKSRVVHHYDDFLLSVRLKMDLPSLSDKSDHHVSSGSPWSAFMALLGLCTKLFAVVSQLGLISHTVRSGNHGMIFAILCIGKPLVRFFQQDLWSIPHIAETTNTDYLRMKALLRLEEKEYRLDILSGDLVQYIISEFRKAREGLGEISTDWPGSQYWEQRGPTTNLIASIAGDLPLMYYAAVALFKPAAMSLSTIASLQQSAVLLRWLFWDIFNQADVLRQNINSCTATLRFGEDCPKSEKGMALELRNVTFSYPGTKENAKVLDDVSFKINPGELCVVVGSNGSGKSTFVKLLTRLYDVNGGSVLVDGEDIRRYKIADLRQTIATLSQDHLASEVLGKLDKGLETVLDHSGLQYRVNVDENTELDTVYKKLKKSVEVSGGERQRLVASRTFMRFKSKKIKFVAVDEPSSALDPEGELKLFNNLREARAGKTMVFVTHRFGHLTKYADKILCMKDGKVAECGTHEELMRKEGEYHKMYKTQAEAFQ